jgi:Bacterial regulatory proteins, lacI family
VARASTQQAMTTLVTMRQIAERAGVSMGTASQVINEAATVRQKLPERLLDAIRSITPNSNSAPFINGLDGIQRAACKNEQRMAVPASEQQLRRAF